MLLLAELSIAMSFGKMIHAWKSLNFTLSMHSCSEFVFNRLNCDSLKFEISVSDNAEYDSEYVATFIPYSVEVLKPKLTKNIINKGPKKKINAETLDLIKIL